MDSPIGLLGCGLLGTQIARRLKAAGFPVLGFDPNRTRLDEFVQLGGGAGENEAAIFRSATRVILSLPDSLVVKEVIERALPFLREGQTVIDTSTGSPADARSLGSRLEQIGVTYLECTVSGSSKEVGSGTALLMVSGDPSHSLDLLEAISSQIVRTGPTGTSSQMKLVTNLVLGLNRAALAEGLRLAEDFGLDLKLALSVLKQSAAYSRAQDAKGEMMITRNYLPPQARLAQHTKDVRLMLQEAQSLLPLTRLHLELLDQLIARGYGEHDNSAIREAFENADSREL